MSALGILIGCVIAIGMGAGYPYVRDWLLGKLDQRDTKRR
jgi:hypothetical protein